MEGKECGDNVRGEIRNIMMQVKGIGENRRKRDKRKS